jgi:HemY protein
VALGALSRLGNGPAPAEVALRLTIWIVLLFVVAVVAATTLGQNDGLASFYWGAWRMDVSLNLFLLLLVGTAFLIVALIQGVDSLVGLPRRAREWRTTRRDRNGQAALREALAQSFAGRYSRAEKAAERALAIQAETPDLRQDDEFSVLGHLLAAESAHRLQNRSARDRHLQQALDLATRSPRARAADEGARLRAAEWALDDRDATRAAELLDALPSGVARRTHALRLRLQAARLGREPQTALRTARQLVKHGAFPQAAADGMLRSLAVETLDRAHDIEQLRAAWLALEAPERRDPYVAARAAVVAARFGNVEDARAWLRPAWDRIGELTRDERTAVAEALVQALDGIGADWISRLEAAATAHPADGAIALAIGCVLAERTLWGKARAPLEQAAGDAALPASARRRAALTLASIVARDGDLNVTAAAYERAARLA